MQWHNHYRDVPEGAHAFLGASKHAWLNYSDDKLIEVFNSNLAKQRGTELHALAAQLIKLKQRLPKSNKTLNSYVNDAIGYGMRPEQPLYYSENCFGTADAILFNEKKSFLRIHDLKTGLLPVHMEQLYIYDALFCLEYHIKPGDIQIVNQIYQNDDIWKAEPTATDIVPIVDKIVAFDEIIRSIKEANNG